MKSSRSKSDLAIITTPFVLTFFLVLVGYQLLISQTPEGKFSIPAQSSNIEILTEDITDIIQPKNPTPTQVVAKITAVPTNRAQLAEVINSVLNSPVNTIYLSLPADIQADGTITLTDQDQSSLENIQRWVKKSVNTAHQNRFHVMLALTLNASEVVTDPGAFTKNYSEFVIPWAKLATEFGISFFGTGITAGHPVFVNLTPAQNSQLLLGTHKSVRQYYTGKIGLNLCCQEQFTIAPAGYNFINLITTDKYSLEVLAPPALNLVRNYQLSHTFIYDRDQQQVRQIDLSSQ